MIIKMSRQLGSLSVEAVKKLWQESTGNSESPHKGNISWTQITGPENTCLSWICRKHGLQLSVSEYSLVCSKRGPSQISQLFNMGHGTRTRTRSRTAKNSKLSPVLSYSISIALKFLDPAVLEWVGNPIAICSRKDECTHGKELFYIYIWW